MSKLWFLLLVCLLPVSVQAASVRGPNEDDDTQLDDNKLRAMVHKAALDQDDQDDYDDDNLDIADLAEPDHMDEDKLSDEGFHIIYTIKSEPTNKNFTGAHFTNVFDGTLPTREYRPLLIDLMDEIAEIDAAFRYKYKIYPKLGKYITAMNGQSEVAELSLHWLVYRLEPHGQKCSLPVGASSYRVTYGESIQWTLAKWNSSIPVCDGGQHK